MPKLPCSRFGLLSFLVIALQLGGLQPANATSVYTYHNNVNRTGWNSTESTLTTKNVKPGRFGLLHTVSLDGLVNAQPLFIEGQSISSYGTRNIVYVATENNTLYAIDGASGVILLSRNFGAAVPDSYKSGDRNVYPVMGILGTPVIDPLRNAIYFVTDTFASGVDVFRLHAVALSTLGDIAQTVIGASTTLSDGTLYNFQSRYQLQRAALLENNGIIYVAFGSNGDINPPISRGLILAYSAASLTPYPAHVTTDRLVESGNFYLTSVWQAGFGPAADSFGNVYFSTGNSDPRYPTYNGTYNLPESVLKVSSDLSTRLDSFTPSNYFALDEGDLDFGSGGTMVVPDQAGSVQLVMAGGKDGRAFLLNRNNLGGYNAGGPDRVVATVNGGPCWCGPAYFVGADNVPRILTGGGNGVISWKLNTSASVSLAEDSATTPAVVSGLPDNGGTYPVVSSNAQVAGTAVVWFVRRPQTWSDVDPGTPLTLYAYDASNLQRQLFSATAGNWIAANYSNATITPTVADGRVYVASNKQLQIFGEFHKE